MTNTGPCNAAAPRGSHPANCRCGFGGYAGCEADVAALGLETEGPLGEEVSPADLAPGTSFSTMASRGWSMRSDRWSTAW